MSFAFYVCLDDYKNRYDLSVINIRKIEHPVQMQNKILYSKNIIRIACKKVGSSKNLVYL